jgi:hypothetical protein
VPNKLCPGLVVAITAISAHLGAQQPPVPQQPTPAESPVKTSPPPMAAQTPDLAQPVKPAGKLPLEWKFEDFTLKFGGYVKVDLIHDFDEIGSTDSFDPRTIPTNDESDPGTATRIHARQTRFNVDLKGPTSIGPFHAFAEGDFFGTGNAFRMRHAYGELGPLLAGQTWSTFMDEDAMPETLDFESPIAFPLIRQGQFRFTHELGEDGSYVAVALEDPDSDVLTGLAGEANEPTPDLTARLRWKNDVGHLQLSGFAGSAQFDQTGGPTDTAFLWGFNFSGKIETWGKDSLMTQVTYGEGVARYRGGNTAAFDSNGDLEAIPVVGAMLGYQHYWCDEWRSTVTYSWAGSDPPSGTPTTATETIDYLAANVIWQFCDRAWAGVEYLYGSRSQFDNTQGEANRVQMSVRFDF